MLPEEEGEAVNKARAWILACRPFAYPWLLVNTLLGVCLAGFDVTKWLLAFAATALVLTSGHFFNAWWDYARGLDRVEGGSKAKPYTAGSQVLPRGWLSLGTVKASTFALLALALPLLILAPARPDVYALFALGVLCAFAYSLWLKPKGLGEVGLFLGHGLATTSFAYALARPLDLAGLAAGVLLGFWAGVIYTIDQWQDVETDFARRVKSLAYLMFRANFRPSMLWMFLVTGAFTLQFGFVLLKALPAGTLLTLLLLPLSHVVAILLDYRFDRGVILGLACMFAFAALAALGAALIR
jgi:1,4-dihydroxy-2-naphthoate octaprenyltransferase